MRYRKLDTNGDYSFGQGQANFLIDDVACVAQKILTRLKLWEGEWFLDTTEGTPWLQQILGKNTKQLYDLAIQTRVLATDGVTKITEYGSNLKSDRELVVTMKVDTQFGEANLSLPLALQ